MRSWRDQSFADFVYVISGSHGMVKVGVSSKPAARLAALQTGSAHHLHLAHALQVNGDAYAAEAEAHRLLSRYRQVGEWFAVPEDVAVAAVGAAVFRHSQSSRIVFPDHPQPDNKTAVLYACGLTALLLCKSPGPFIVFAFVGLTIGLYRIIRMRAAVTWPYFWQLMLTYLLATIVAIVAAAAVYPIA